MANGVVSFLFDPDQHLTVTDQWAADHKVLGVDWVRVVIKADNHNYIEREAYKRALAVYNRAGIKVLALFDQDFNRPWLGGNQYRMIYPNEAPGYGGNPRQNRWIKDTVIRAELVGMALADQVDAWLLGNEPDLQASIPIGANVPPISSDKGPAMAPELFCCFGWEVAHALRRFGKPIYLGALSWLPTSGDDQANPYDAGYLRKGLAYLRSTGAHDTPWDGVALNCEGWWTRDKAQRMAASLHSALSAYNAVTATGDLLPLIIGEWGVQNGHSVDAGKAAETHAALRSISTHQFFFEYPARVAHAVTDYGVRDWTVANGGFYPFGDPLPWQPILYRLFGTS